METKTKNELMVIIFQLKNEEYALDISHVRSIEKMYEFTRVPNSNPLIKGVIYLRGIITPIIDLRKRLNIEEKEYDDKTKILIIANGTSNNIGFIVDGANDVVTISTSEIEPTPEVLGVEEEDYLTGIVKYDGRLVTLLSTDKLLNF